MKLLITFKPIEWNKGLKFGSIIPYLELKYICMLSSWSISIWINYATPLFLSYIIKNKVYILLPVGYNHRHSANHRQWFRQSGKIWPESNFLLIVIVVSTCAQEIMHGSTIAIGRFSHIFGEARIHPNHSTYYYILLWRETLQIFIVGSLCVCMYGCVATMMTIAAAD